jgi:hypothetical protein
MSARSILKQKSVSQLKAELKALEAELATCGRCSELECLVRESCEDNELAKQKKGKP